MNQLKIVFAGPMGAGKTTAIANLSEIPPVRTEAPLSSGARGDKSTTTVAMDYGELTLADGLLLLLYGTPGQDRFDFMWEVLTEGCFGICILIDHSQKDALTDLTYYLERFEALDHSAGIVIGLTHAETAEPEELEGYYDKLDQHDTALPLLTVDVREREQVASLIEAMVSYLQYQT